MAASTLQRIVDIEIYEDLDFFGDIDLPDNMTCEDLSVNINIDNDLEVTGTYSDEELVHEARKNVNKTDFNDDDDEDIEEDISCADVVAALKLVGKFAQKIILVKMSHPYRY